MNNIPLSLYIHFPWCIKKCPYCDFNSHSIKKNKFYIYKKYLLKVINDLKKNIFIIKNRKIKTIFIGGGTPSLLNKKLIKLLMQELKNILKFKKDIEITIEANPIDIKKEKIKIYKKIGINRISIGAQSFNNMHLKLLGRLHNRKNILSAIKTINDNSFKNYNIDIMYGLPKQNIKQALDDLYQAILLKPTHISWYQLTIEPNTIFSIKTPELPTHEKNWEILKKGKKLLNSYGYKHYEISSYAKKKYYCKHNMNYWNFGDYLGIGAGSHSKITDKNYKILRFNNINNPYFFLSNKKKLSFYKLNNNDKILEFFMNKFRIFNKLNKKDFYKYTGMKTSLIEKKMFCLSQQGYLKIKKDYWTLTMKGKNFLNNLLEFFLI